VDNVNKAIDLRNSPGQGLISRIFPLSLALLIALPGIASAQSAAAGPAADQPATTPSTPAPSTSGAEPRTDMPRPKQGLTGSSKRTAAAGTGTPPPADMRGWVPRLDYKHCPNGTTSFVASDGGVKCWAGPVD